MIIINVDQAEGAGLHVFDFGLQSYGQAEQGAH